MLDEAVVADGSVTVTVSAERVRLVAALECDEPQPAQAAARSTASTIEAARAESRRGPPTGRSLTSPGPRERDCDAVRHERTHAIHPGRGPE